MSSVRNPPVSIDVLISRISQKGCLAGSVGGSSQGFVAGEEGSEVMSRVTRLMRRGCLRWVGAPDAW